MKRIPGFSRYSVFDNGTIFSHRAGKFLSSVTDRDGYIRYMLVDDNGSKKNVKAHRIVMLAFLGVCPDGYVVNHINGIKSDNFPGNLEYVTHTENMRHAVRIGLRDNVKGERHYRSKISDLNVKLMRAFAKTGDYTVQKLAKVFGISRSTASKIVNYQIHADQNSMNDS